MTSYFWPLKSSDANLMKLPKLLCKKNLNSTLISSLCRTISVPKMTSTSADQCLMVPSSQRDSTSNVAFSYQLWKIRCQAGEHTRYIRWNMKLVSNCLLSIHRDIYKARQNKVETVQPELRTTRQREEVTEAVFSYMSRRFHFLGDQWTNKHSYQTTTFSTIVLHCCYPKVRFQHVPLCSLPFPTPRGSSFPPTLCAANPTKCRDITKGRLQLWKVPGRTTINCRPRGQEVDIACIYIKYISLQIL